MSAMCAFQRRESVSGGETTHHIWGPGWDLKKTKGKVYWFGAIIFRKQRRNRDFSGWNKQLKAKAEM